MTSTGKSLRTRLLLGALLWFLAGVMGGGLLISGLFRYNLTTQYHDELQVHLAELEGLTATRPNGQPYLIRRLSDPRYLPLHSGFYWQVERRGFGTVRSPSLGHASLSNALATSFERRYGWRQGPTGMTLEYAKLARPAADGAPIRLMIASDRAILDNAVHEFDRILYPALALFSLFLFAVGAGLTRTGLTSLRQLAQAVADIRTNQSDRVEGQFPSEIAPLVDEFNAVLHKNEEMIRHSRLASSNLAHGLRTPLAILMTQAEQLIDQGQPQTGEAMLREIDRMNRIVNLHLASTRVAEQRQMVHSGVSLRDKLAILLPALARLHRDKSIAFTAADLPDVKLMCDKDDLTEILSIPLDNAGKWAGARCHISWDMQDGEVAIHIDDDGPGLSLELRKEAFEAGRRLDETKPGSGLGLAIARELAAKYGGQIVLRDSPLGGLRVTIRMI